MATYSDLLRERLAQISGNAEALTTWERLKAQREKQKAASLAAISGVQGQTSAYQQQLANLAQMYGSGSYSKPSSLPSTAKKKKPTKKKKAGSLGDSIGSIGDAIGGIFG
jgi:hypothetical protein